jgi:hypothetical protein
VPCKPFNKCFDFHHQKIAIVTFTDKRSSTTFVYRNNSLDDLTKYKVDGCLIADDGAKCDCLLLNCDNKKCYFIELKGSDLIRAVEQIDRALDILVNHLHEFSVEARIVLTRVNTIDLRSSKYLKLEKRIKKLNGELKKQSRQMTEIN